MTAVETKVTKMDKERVKFRKALEELKKEKEQVGGIFKLCKTQFLISFQLGI